MAIINIYPATSVTTLLSHSLPPVLLVIPELPIFCISVHQHIMFLLPEIAISASSPDYFTLSNLHPFSVGSVLLSTLDTD